MHENKDPVWLDTGLGHAHPRRTLPQQPSAASVDIMPPAVRESGFARSTETSAGRVPGSGAEMGPRPLPERLLWKNKITKTGYGPEGVDTLAYSAADMYQSMARVHMGRSALRSATAAAGAAQYPTPSSGYAKQIAPLIRAQNKPFGPLETSLGYGAFGLGATS